MRGWAWRLPACCVVLVCVACDTPAVRHSGQEARPFVQFQDGLVGPGPEKALQAPGYHSHGSPQAVGQLPPQPPPPPPPRHAGAPRDLRVLPAPLPASDHELKFNVSWLPPPGPGPAPTDYSLEIRGATPTADCAGAGPSLCYEYDIPGEARWWTMPESASAVEGAGCALRPACAYTVRLVAHPWDGRTAATLEVALDECVMGVCSCGHAARLSRPQVRAQLLQASGQLAVNVSWSLPPAEKRGLPPHLLNDHYFVSVGRQLVSSGQGGGLAPWYAHEVSGRAPAAGATVGGDSARWLLLALPEPRRTKGRGPDNQSERGKEGRGKAEARARDKERERLLVRVALVDNRGCTGPVGNYTLFDRNEDAGWRSHMGTYAAWTLAWLACALGAAGAGLLGARRVKRALARWRAPPPAPAPSPLRRQPAWLPLQCRIPGEGCAGAAGAAGEEGPAEELSPLYVEKEIEKITRNTLVQVSAVAAGSSCILDLEDESGDPYEVSWSRVRLGALIGRGAFGRVHAAQVTLPAAAAPVTVAVKMLDDDATAEEKADFLCEIATLKSVGAHEHVIRLVACCTRRAPLAALLEHARGDLLALLRAARRAEHYPRPRDSDDTSRAPSGRPSEADTEYTNLSAESGSKCSEEGSEARACSAHYVAEPALRLDGATMRRYALEVALGMAHLERLGITHRDLAARNILVDAGGALKVADFGLSRAGVYVHTRSRPVPLRWLAPEAILESLYSSASDVWAYAVLLWEIATLGGFPYAELSNQEVPAFLTSGGRLARPPRASPRLYELMLACWAAAAPARPSFAAVVARLTAHAQLYVDLDCVFPALEEEVSRALREEDFSFGECSPELSPARFGSVSFCSSGSRETARVSRDSRENCASIQGDFVA